MDALETKSVAESDTGQVCGDLLSVSAPNFPPAVAETDYDEPSLSDIIVEGYKGSRGRNGHFEGFGEAQFTGGHSYEGTFSHGVMHGKGKYVWSDGMLYDGDMNNNQITGYGRYEWPDKSYYEGEVLNGLRHGVGVFKSPQHNVSYSGQWYLGKRHGRGIMHYSEHSWFEGDWVNNARHGWGVRRYNTGNVYEGQWVNDKRHGEGTMRWLTSDESYSGVWENGVQHGVGTHTWYLHRVPGSQYPLRNEYVGDFINGLRHGQGKFFFASGAVYNGEWENNKKHGWGKFIFKNGRVFEGQFENDHMVDYPAFTTDGTESPDSCNIRTRTPIGWEEGGKRLVKILTQKKDMAKDGSGNMLGPSLTLDIEYILEDFAEDLRNEELKQVTFLMLRNVSALRRVYSFYSALGHDRSPDNTFVMTRFQFWRFLKDCRIHHHSQTLSSMDRAIARCHAAGDVHNPMEKLLLREFLSSCVILSYFIYKDKVAIKTGKVISNCLQNILQNHILKYSCRVGGHFLFEPRRAVNALAYMDRCWQIYQRVCTKRVQPPYDLTLRMRQFLFLLQDLKVIGRNLSTGTVLQILSADDPTVTDGDSCNMELEMTFLEFFEALIGCAVHYVAEQTVASSSYISEDQIHRLSRPGSSVSQVISEPGNHQASSVISGSHISQVFIHHFRDYDVIRVVSTGEFLQTLSQMSIHDETNPAERSYGDSVVNQSQRAESEDGSLHRQQESEFNIWNNQLHIFFTQHLFPPWQRHEMLKDAAAKNRIAEEERKRLRSIEKEVERQVHVSKCSINRRRELQSSQEVMEQPVEEPEPVPTELEIPDEDTEVGVRSAGRSGKSRKR
uniref:Radial spoke head 10 homolog B-like n=1 Tax=Ciona intestinalis TaxID=7719 RepID=H2XNT1_CIOIN